MFFRYGWKLFVLIVIGAFVFVWLIKAPIMSSYISTKLKVPLTFRSISIWPTESIIRHFQIPNPSDYGGAALKVDKIVVGYDYGRLTEIPAEINLIELDGVYLNIVLAFEDKTDNNWAEIGATMPKGRTGRDVIVHKLVINDLSVETQGAEAQRLGIAGTQSFDHMEFNEIDSREGFPTKELIDRIFEGAGIEAYIRRFLNPEGYIKKAMNPLNRIFGENEKSSQFPGSPN